MVNAVMLRPLPFQESDRLMRLWHTPPPLFAGQQVFPLSPANFLDWQEQSRSFESMAIYGNRPRTLTGQGEPDALLTARASAAMLPILRMQPIIGRAFTADEDRAGGERTVILSEGTWRNRFGAQPTVLGQKIMLDGEPHTVVGVAPQATAFVSRVQLWVPLAWSDEDRATRENHNYLAIARLAPGVSVEQAQADLTTISRRLEQQYPEANKDWGARVLPLHEDLVGDVRPSLLVLLGAVGLVLLIACANLANLLLVRTHGRAKEIAVRTALGASRARVMQQLAVEGLLLGVCGGLAGLLTGVYGVRVLVALFGTQLPRVADVTVDGSVLVFTLAVSILTGLTAAAAPAWQFTKRDANTVLKQGAERGSSSGGDGRVRQLLVVSEVALALMLLVGAGLLVRSMAGLRALDPGFDPRSMLTATIDVPEAKYPTIADRVRFFDRVLQNVRALPGVVSASSVDTLPLQGGSSQPVAVEGMPIVQQSEQPVVAVRISAPGYFNTADIPFVNGRDFGEQDGGPNRPSVAIVSEQTAARFWPGRSPIGQHITLGLMSNEPREVVGVVGEVRVEQLDGREPEPTIYLPTVQLGFSNTTLVIRTAVPPNQPHPRGDRRRACGGCRAARARHHDHGRRGGGVAGAAPLRDVAAGGLCRTRAAVGVDRHLQRAGVRRSTAGPRDRHPHGARRAVNGGCPHGDARGPEAHRHRSRAGAVAGGGPGSSVDDAALRRHRTRPGHARRGGGRGHSGGPGGHAVAGLSRHARGPRPHTPQRVAQRLLPRSSRRALRIRWRPCHLKPGAG